jgi:type II secretory pathway component PulF
MPEAAQTFEYLAIDTRGKRMRGQLEAISEERAFAALKQDGLTPTRLIPKSRRRSTAPRSGALKEAELEALLTDLAALLHAGADVRSSLTILGRRGGSVGLSAACERLSASIGGGDGAEMAFAQLLGKRFEVIPALVAAGEAGGDLAAGLERGSQILAGGRAIREQLISALSYPAFVLLSTLGAMGLILFAVVPTLAPLVEDAGGKAPAVLGALLAVSGFVTTNALWIGGGVAVALVVVLILARAGALTRPLQRLALDGPVRSVFSALVFGGFAQSLGGMLSAGAPMSEALRLAIRTAPWIEARDRLAPVLADVRQGEQLSVALESVQGFPSAIARLTAVGEATGALGPMLVRSGAFEEARALTRIEATAKVLGPALIVVLGGLIGLLMASLLTGVTGLGEAALH